MTAPELRKGETLEITLRGVAVSIGMQNLVFEIGDERALIPLKVLQSDAVTIERTAPAQWPPKPGDVWTDRDGEPWFARKNSQGEIFLSPLALTASSRKADSWLAQSAPATLAYRVGYEMPCWHTELPDADEPDGEACTGEVPVVDWLASNARAHGDREHVGPEKIRVGDLIIANTAPRIVVDVDPGVDGTPFEIHHRNQRGGPLRTLSVHKGGQVERIRGGAS